MLQKQGLPHYPCRVIELLPGDQVQILWGVTEEQASKKLCKVQESVLPAEGLLKWDTLASSDICKSSPHTPHAGSHLTLTHTSLNAGRRGRYKATL